jgi:hypothetical protein
MTVGSDQGDQEGSARRRVWTLREIAGCAAEGWAGGTRDVAAGPSGVYRRVARWAGNVRSEGETLPDASSIQIGGVEFEGAWVRCQAQASFKPEEAFVKLAAEDTPRPLGFYVDKTLVRPEELGPEETQGEVRVAVLGRDNGSATVQVLGEPVSFGPRITVPSYLFTSAY